MGELEKRPQGPAHMRISDADRNKVAEVLRDAAGEGRIQLDELDERLEATWAAKTYADLVPITADLQVGAAVAPAYQAGVPALDHASSTAILGDCKRRGAWQVPAQHTAFSLLGSVLIDLREAILTSHETVINASAIMGDVKILVPAHFHVVVDGTPILGDYTMGKDKVRPDLRPDSPVIRVRGMSLMGSVTAQRVPAPGTRKKFLGTF